jgi:hypothetical protein
MWPDMYVSDENFFIFGMKTFPDYSIKTAFIMPVGRDLESFFFGRDRLKFDQMRSSQITKGTKSPLR